MPVCARCAPKPESFFLKMISRWTQQERSRQERFEPRSLPKLDLLESFLRKRSLPEHSLRERSLPIASTVDASAKNRKKPVVSKQTRETGRRISRKMSKTVTNSMRKSKIGLNFTEDVRRPPRRRSRMNVMELDPKKKRKKKSKMAGKKNTNPLFPDTLPNNDEGEMAGKPTMESNKTATFNTNQRFPDALPNNDDGEMAGKPTTASNKTSTFNTNQRFPDALPNNDDGEMAGKPTTASNKTSTFNTNQRFPDALPNNDDGEMAGKPTKTKKTATFNTDDDLVDNENNHFGANSSTNKQNNYLSSVDASDTTPDTSEKFHNTSEKIHNQDIYNDFIDIKSINNDYGRNGKRIFNKKNVGIHSTDESPIDKREGRMIGKKKDGVGGKLGEDFGFVHFKRFLDSPSNTTCGRRRKPSFTDNGDFFTEKIVGHVTKNGTNKKEKFNIKSRKDGKQKKKNKPETRKKVNVKTSQTSTIQTLLHQLAPQIPHSTLPKLTESELASFQLEPPEAPPRKNKQLKKLLSSRKRETGSEPMLGKCLNLNDILQLLRQKNNIGQNNQMGTRFTEEERIEENNRVSLENRLLAMIQNKGITQHEELAKLIEDDFLKVNHTTDRTFEERIENKSRVKNFPQNDAEFRHQNNMQKNTKALKDIMYTDVIKRSYDETYSEITNDTYKSISEDKEKPIIISDMSEYIRNNNDIDFSDTKSSFNTFMMNCSATNNDQKFVSNDDVNDGLEGKRMTNFEMSERNQSRIDGNEDINLTKSLGRDSCGRNTEAIYSKEKNNGGYYGSFTTHQHKVIQTNTQRVSHPNTPRYINGTRDNTRGTVSRIKESIERTSESIESDVTTETTRNTVSRTGNNGIVGFEKGRWEEENEGMRIEDKIRGEMKIKKLMGKERSNSRKINNNKKIKNKIIKTRNTTKKVKNSINQLHGDEKQGKFWKPNTSQKQKKVFEKHLQLFDTLSILSLLKSGPRFQNKKLVKNSTGFGNASTPKNRSGSKNRPGSKESPGFKNKPGFENRPVSYNRRSTEDSTLFRQNPNKKRKITKKQNKSNFSFDDKKSNKKKRRKNF